MLLEMFVNELSLAPIAVDVETARARAEQYVRTMLAATARGVQRALRQPDNFYASPIAQGYYWQNWLADNRIDLELRRYFRSLTTKAPFLYDEERLEAAWGEIDCLWADREALGLKAAYVADGIAVSILSHEDWDTGSVQCEIQQIIEEDVTCSNESIHHAALPRHIEAQSNWIQQRIQTSVRNGAELWALAGDFFPSLVCCAAVQEQMLRLPHESLASITRGLFHLNAYCVGWQAGAYDPRGISCDVSPESDSTLQMYGAQRTFLCPDGHRRVFNWHAKVGRWRIHFDPAAGPGRLFIGYVGQHLPTAKFH